MGIHPNPPEEVPPTLILGGIDGDVFILVFVGFVGDDSLLFDVALFRSRIAEEKVLLQVGAKLRGSDHVVMLSVGMALRKQVEQPLA
jgi:hypothetical protein